MPSSDLYVTKGSAWDAQFPMTLVFSRDDPDNCIIHFDENPIYEVKTRREIVKKATRNDLAFTTDVFRFGATQDLLATVVFREGTPDLITWPDRGMKAEKLSGWLKKNLITFSHTLLVQVHENNLAIWDLPAYFAVAVSSKIRAYSWDTKGPRDQFRLTTDTDTVVAYFERANPYVNLEPGYNYNPAPKPSCLHLSCHADSIRDDVVLSFLVVEKNRRRSDGSRERYADAQAYGRSYFGAVEGTFVN